MNQVSVIATVRVIIVHVIKTDAIVMGINRANKRKHKGGCGCKMCKPHKGKWAPFFKDKDKSTMDDMDNQIKEL